MDDDKTNAEIWYCNYCKIIVTNGDVELTDKNKIQSFFYRIFFGVSAYRSLKTKKKSNKS